MIDYRLDFARVYEKEEGGKVPDSARPVFHLTPWVGWMNDPNGFSYYQGQYHLFYQYHPYDIHWNAMHWGHAVSHDLLHWTYLPAVLAPDASYDSYGCFSGSAMELPDGRQLLLYTGVRKENGGRGKEYQTQCVAVGDGLDYRKYENNPVLDDRDLPEGLSPNDFRDPKIWRRPDGGYRCVVASRRMDRRGVLLLYDSDDGFQWHFVSILAENDGRFGLMWECPDFFQLNDKSVLFVSPQDMLPAGSEYHNGNGTVCQIGMFDGETNQFIPECDQAVDYGIDFYAPQTILTPDNRRVMIAWMQNWDTCKMSDCEEHLWCGQMTLPRELSIRHGRLYQQPIRELAQYRSQPVEYRNVEVMGSMTLEGIEGRSVELDMHIRPEDAGSPYQKFSMRFAQDDQYFSTLSFCPRESLLKMDRTYSGTRRAYVHQCCCRPVSGSGEIHLHVILDRFSIEVFVNDGAQTMTATIFTDPSARGICFEADGKVLMDISKYSLFAE